MSNDEKKSTLKTLYDLAITSAKFYKDKSAVIYCLPNDGNMLMNLNSDDFESWLVNLCRLRNGLFCSPDSVRNILPHFRFNDKLINLDYFISKRCAYRDEKIYIDLADEKHSVICVNKKEVKVLDRTDPPLLKTSESMVELPMPDLNYRPENLLGLIEENFAVNKKQRVLLTIWLVLSFIDSIQIPIICIMGQKGSSKSTLTKQVKTIVDNSADTTVLLPENLRDLAILLDTQYCVSLDNISVGDIKSKMSDLLAISITKGTYVIRELYKNSVLTRLRLSNRLIINGIDLIINKSDALDRSIILTLPRLPLEQMKSPKTLEEKFKKDHPKIFGAICNTLIKVMCSVDNVNVENFSRMNDFVKYGYCCASSLGIDPDVFLQIYKENLLEVNEALLNEDVIGMCIIQIMQTKSCLTESVTKLHQRVIEVAKTNSVSARELPASPNHFSKQLFDIKSNLEEFNIFVTKKNVGNHKEITLEKKSLE